MLEITIVICLTLVAIATIIGAAVGKIDTYYVLLIILLCLLVGAKALGFS